MERLIEALPARMPADDTVTIAHGDYRPENVMFHLTEPRGDRRARLGAVDPRPSRWPTSPTTASSITPIPRAGGRWWMWTLEAAGIPSESEYVAAYCRRTGRTGIEDFNFYLAFSIFRLASIGQGVFKRNLDGIGNADAAPDNAGTHQLAATAREILER